MKVLNQEKKEKKQVNNKWTLIKFSLLDGWTLKGYKKIGALDDEHKGIKAKNVTRSYLAETYEL